MGTGSPPDGELSDPVLSDWTRSTAPADPAASPSGAGAPADGALLFTPGTMLAGRYRVVARLGRGGMGEVYRADDVKLGQAVALKFVRGALSPALLERLYGEVRLGRQVAHPSVCRLYDVVEVDGQTFLAMEYVDGEDLASLLARIGRLPADKALEVARDLCAGLAAIHERGIVHRDLKPANVMIDGRGRARITDFGLAVASTAGGNHAFAGTPAYMAPEQLAGGEVTARSDLYALGLVLYEMVSGRRFFEARTVEELVEEHRGAKGGKLISVARLLEGSAGRAVLQCLEEDAAARPPSARSVLGLLPGHDPLEAAVAAGETPSPEAVAAAGRVGDLTPGKAWLALGVCLASLLVSIALVDRTAEGRLVPKPPEVLAERARAVLERLGAPKGATDAAYAFDWDRAYLSHARQQPGRERWRRPDAPFTPLTFFYRQSPRRLVAANRDGVVRRDDPPATLSGMSEVLLDSRGVLLGYLAVPLQKEPAHDAGVEPDWRPLFEEAGLPPEAFHEAAPEWAAPVDTDRKRAWEGVHPDDPTVPLRIEAAAYRGRPVWFAVIAPWTQPTRMPDARDTRPPTPVGDAGVWILAMAMPVGGVILARRNLKLGRGDRKGAFRVALFVFASFSLARLFRADHVAVFGEELWLLIKVLAYPSFWAAQVWLLYMALEPYARRRWPHTLISWKRLLAGQLRDPLVGRDLLLGMAAGALTLVLFLLSQIAPTWLAMPQLTPDPFLQGDALTAFRHVGFRIFVNQFSAVLFAMVFLFMLVLLRLLARRDWLAMALWCLLVGGPMQGENLAVEWAFGLVRAVGLLAVLMNGGLLALVACLVVLFTAIEVPLTFDLSAWYATRGLPVALLLVGLALYGFHTSLAGRPVFGRALDD
jgi:serine/threonine-protein kinase